jgi:hypothetical protein
MLVISQALAEEGRKGGREGRKKEGRKEEEGGREGEGRKEGRQKIKFKSGDNGQRLSLELGIKGGLWHIVPRQVSLQEVIKSSSVVFINLPNVISQQSLEALTRLWARICVYVGSYR